MLLVLETGIFSHPLFHRPWKSKGTFKEQENEYLKEFRPKEDFLRILVHAAGMEARCNNKGMYSKYIKIPF